VTVPDAEMNTYDDLPPMQSLVLEVMCARYRLGENSWTFSTRHRRALEGLAERGLMGWKHGVMPRTCLAWLTDKGRESLLSNGYRAPLAFTRDRLAGALTRLEVKVQLTGPIAGMINAESMADAIIEALGKGEGAQ